ncbi:hypothetical protein CRE_22523 [Caenorhabditis remanei]|uniref:DUF7809 domain-containing protein n=1 Tax=Caenorhabditis remanei TaxID=31234 RepID=E3MU69_CAERE|nr:hypothetical protein CRE_22523 [Caenorhabditis remanei]
MSKYLKSPDNMLTPTSLESIAHSYILNELRSSINKNIFSEEYYLESSMEENGKELLQQMLDNSNYKLRMYGSAEELAQNLKIYHNFPKSYRFFKTEFEPYTTTTTLYRSLKNEEYICKSDLFPILQNMALNVFPAADSYEVFSSILGLLFNEQNKLPHRMEFIKFDQKVFDEIEMEMREASQLCVISDAELAVLGAQLEAGNFDSLFAKFEKVHMKENLSKKDSDGIHEYLKEYYSELKESDLNPAQYLVVFLVTTAAMICLNKIIHVKRPEMFHPNSINNSPMIVRLFEEGDQKFVMESELAIAMWPKKASEIFAKKGEVGFHEYTTITLDEAIRKGAGRVEFIRYPIKRTKHRAVPIEGPDPEDPNDWCILAVDAFFESMKSIITGVEIFQKNPILSAKAFDCIAPVFSALEELFKPEVKSPYFVKIECVNDMLTIIQKNMNLFPNKDVRNANKEGFTAQNLKNELTYLGLTVIFPDIQEYAEDVYQGIDKAKKERYLRTCDLCDAVESCQLICILHRIPNLKKFLHNQKGCGRVFGYKCEHCDEEKDVQKTSNIQNSLKSLKIESSSPSMLNKYAQPALPAPKDCDKCLQSSKVLTETQNELKISQDQLKEMQQKITNTEKELSDLNKEHEKIVESEAKKTEELTEMKEELSKGKEQIQEKEEEILKASKENEGLQKTILKLTAENESNERTIQKLLDRITNSSTNNQKNNRINEKTIEESTPTASVTSKNAPLVIDCLICSSQIKAGQEVIRCPLCKRRFHSNVIFSLFSINFPSFSLFSCPDNVLFSNIVYSHVNAYILPALRPFLHRSESNWPTKLVYDDGEEVIQRMLVKSNNKLRMYGSVKELAENIKIFRNFTESFRFFDDDTYPFNASPIIYESLKGEKYICKPDIYTIIQNIALNVFPQKSSVFFEMLAKFLKFEVGKNNGPVEFVKFDQNFFDEIENEMRECQRESDLRTVIF